MMIYITAGEHGESVGEHGGSMVSASCTWGKWPVLTCMTPGSVSKLGALVGAWWMARGRGEIAWWESMAREHGGGARRESMAREHGGRAWTVSASCMWDKWPALASLTSGGRRRSSARWWEHG